MENQETLEEQFYSIVKNTVKKIKKEERRYKQLQSQLSAIEEKEQQLQQAFPYTSEYWLMGIECFAALIFDFFVSRTTVSWLATLIGIPAALVALLYTVLDATFAALASGKSGKDDVSKRLLQKQWQKFLWGLAFIKIMLFAAFIFIVRQDSTTSLVFNLLELLFQTAMVGIIYYVLHHAGGGILYAAKKTILVVRKLAIGTPQRRRAKIQKLCFEFLEEVQNTKLDLEKICQREEYQDICNSCVALIAELKSFEPISSGEQPSPPSAHNPLEAQLYTGELRREVQKNFLSTIGSRAIQKLIDKILRNQQNLKHAVVTRKKIELQESKIQDRFNPTAHYVLLYVVSLVVLILDFFLSRSTLGWLSSLTHIPSNLLALLVTVLDGVIAALASGKTRTLAHESRQFRTVWSTALWSVASIKIVLFLLHVFAYKAYIQILNLAPIVEILILVGLILIMYFALFWAGEGLVWVTENLRLLLWNLAVPPPNVYQEKLYRLCDKLQSLLKEYRFKPQIICRVYKLDCEFCNTKSSQNQ